MIRFLPLAALCLCLSFAAPAHAQLAVDRLWIDFDGSENRGDVVLRNESEDRYYISVVPSEIIEPGTENERRVEVPDPEVLGLLVTPNRMIVDPEGMRAIRIVALDADVESDRVYRVKVTPQVGAIEGSSAGPEDRGIALKVLAAYDLLVTVRPRNGKAKLTTERTAKGIVIRNVGNTNTLLYEGRVCPSPDAGDTQCGDVEARRLFPGNEFIVPTTEPGAVLKFMQRTSAYEDPREIVL